MKNYFVLKASHNSQFNRLHNFICLGVCTCVEGWDGPDCSIDLRAGPRVASLANNGLCDVRTKPCRRLAILGDNFARDRDLSCTFEVYKVNISCVYVLYKYLKRNKRTCYS